MIFEWFAFPRTLYLDLRLSLPGYLVILAYTILVIGILVRNHADFVSLTMRQWGLLCGLLILVPALAGVLVLRLEPSIPGLSLPLLGLLPVLAAAVWLGTGPATLIGVVTGLAWASFHTTRITQPFELAILGATTTTMLTQRYRGAIGDWLRHPVVAAPLSGLVMAWPLTLIGIFATGPTPALANLERAITALLPTLIVCIGGTTIAGGVFQVALIRHPAWHPVHDKALLTPPWDQHLNRRMLYMLVPLMALAIVILVGVVSLTSYHVAVRLVIEQMARDAANASSGVPFFFQVGRGLIRDLARDEQLATSDSEARQIQLVEGLRAVPFFQQLVYLNIDKDLLNSYPDTASWPLDLSHEEESRVHFALSEGIPAEVMVYREAPRPIVTMSFIAPVIDPDTEEPVGALVGRTVLDTNPTLSPVIDVLSRGLGGSGEGIIIGDQNRILLYPAQPERQLESFEVGTATEIKRTAGNGQAFRQRESDGTRRLVYILPVVGQSDWVAVVIVPNEAALALAVQIALPTLLLLVAMTSVAVPLIIVIMRRVTEPLDDLLRSADLMAEGELDRPVHVTGEDEIGRLGNAFEQMRLRLKRRLGEQERLLSVSRSVSSSLELFRAMPPILSSALDVANAVGVRIVLRRDDEGPLQTYAAGEAAAAMAALDAQLIDLVERQGTVVISQIWRASPSLDVKALPPRIRSLVALPLRRDRAFYGTLWLSYDHEHVPEQSEMTFLSTLAGQAAVAVANAWLFTEAEERGRKLEAVLESTTDAMIVADNHGRIVLMNPAAEKYFDTRSDQARGRKAAEVINVPALAALLTNPQEPVAVFELPRVDGKTFLANTSTIVSHSGAITGRVAVLRDISTLKELDNLKTVFLRMVSHDMRSPLTYMRGYTSMLALSGYLNERQQDAVDKINSGIDHITELTERLLYLSRLKFGDEAELELVLVDVAELLREVELEQASLAQQKGISLHIEIEERLPLLVVDGMLYHHALINLVNNGIKYTPDGGEGEVTVRAFKETVNGEKCITVSVADNGIGIRPEDQPQLFEAFFRAPHRPGDPPRPPGSGLGLVLVKAIADAHGGTVGAESQFGVGSRFHISMPIKDPSEIREDENLEPL